MMRFGKWIFGHQGRLPLFSRRSVRPQKTLLLNVEVLEGRLALAGDLGAELNVPSLPSVEPSGQNWVEMAPLGEGDLDAATAPVACEPPVACDGNPTPAGGGPAPDGQVDVFPMGLIPPRIVPFDYAWTGTNITVYGQVLDDGPVGSLLVEFGGLLANITTFTDDDGWFSITVQLGQNFGQITAVATDVDGVTSAVAVINLF